MDSSVRKFLETTFSDFAIRTDATAGAGHHDPIADYRSYRASVLKEHFPNVTLFTQENKPLRFYDDVVRGKIVVIQFMYTNCEKLCPMTTPNLVKLRDELERRAPGQISMVSITVDPANDTPEVLRHYASSFKIAPAWKFLTGKKSDIDLIRRQLGVYDPDEARTEHLNVLTIGDERAGRWCAIEALARPEDIAATALRVAAIRSGVPGENKLPAKVL